MSKSAFMLRMASAILIVGGCFRAHVGLAEDTELRTIRKAPDKRVLSINRKTPWDMRALERTPKVYPAPNRPVRGMRSLFYEGADYKGAPTRVFAYYGTPAGKPPAGGWPAVVCAHGGGGTAFSTWVKYWNDRGYAAIAMDLEGHLPGTHWFQVEGNYPAGQGHEHAGPARVGWFGDIALPDTEQWFYHAVADVIRANSLLRSFPEINADKIGLTGISWGGTIASAVAGVDSRFVFVVPVYGGGYIHKHDMTPEQYAEYLAKWDPSAHLPHAKMPMLWVSSYSEPVFRVDLFSKSAATSGGQSLLCLRPWLIHGHGYGWEEAWEIYAFANSIVLGTDPLPVFERPVVDMENGSVSAGFKGDVTGALLSYTTAGGPWKDRKWANVECEIKAGKVVGISTLPRATKAFVINAYMKSNLVSSEIVVLNE